MIKGLSGVMILFLLFAGSSGSAAGLSIDAFIFALGSSSLMVNPITVDLAFSEQDFTVYGADVDDMLTTTVMS